MVWHEQRRQLRFQRAQVTPKTNNMELFIISVGCVPKPQPFGIEGRLAAALSTNQSPLGRPVLHSPPGPQLSLIF